MEKGGKESRLDMVGDAGRKRNERADRPKVLMRKKGEGPLRTDGVGSDSGRSVCSKTDHKCVWGGCFLVGGVGGGGGFGVGVGGGGGGVLGVLGCCGGFCFLCVFLWGGVVVCCGGCVECGRTRARQKSGRLSQRRGGV